MEITVAQLVPGGLVASEEGLDVVNQSVWGLQLLGSQEEKKLLFKLWPREEVALI